MKTELSRDLLATDVGQEADRILRSCVHCGFCLATCPTYQLLGDELDSPRGRIFQIKELLETGEASASTREHLDCCLTCQACETTCPSGVDYHKLLHTGQQELDKLAPRSQQEAFKRKALVWFLTQRWLFTPLLRLGQGLRVLMPKKVKAQIPVYRSNKRHYPRQHTRKMLLLKGCVQPGLHPGINTATQRVLDRLDIEAFMPAGETCCGALPYHLGDTTKALNMARQDIDVWMAELEQDAESLVMTASGCGNFVREYADILQHDPDYSEKAAKLVSRVQDISEVLNNEDLEKLKLTNSANNRPELSMHNPCTLKHGQGIGALPAQVMQRIGFKLKAADDDLACCGSAGTYSIFQPELSEQLKQRKLAALQKNQPDTICSSNIGCICHLQSGTSTPVKHWIELISEELAD